jgi:glycosyltransferase involved in cell wall biosynthesis
MRKVSIITINLNNAAGLQKTIDSVRNQSMPPCEYIVIDGASEDESVDILKKSAAEITYWTTEKDNGVYHAMNKGLAVATGDYVLFLNSGDHLYHEDVLKDTADHLGTFDLVYGTIMEEQNGKIFNEKKYPKELTFNFFFLNGSLPHPATFIRRSLFDQLGPYNQDFKIVSDWEFWVRAVCLLQATYNYIDYPITVFNRDGISSNHAFFDLALKEKQIVYEKYFKPFYKDYLDFYYLTLEFEKLQKQDGQDQNE